jgi:hypothetical protein
MVSRITKNSSAISSTWATTTHLTCEARGGEMCFQGAGSCQYTQPSCRLRNSQLLFERRPMYTKCIRYVSDKKTGLHTIQPHKMEADNVEWQVGYSLPILSSYISSTLMCTCLAPRPQKLNSIIISLVIERNCPRDMMMMMRPLLCSHKSGQQWDLLACLQCVKWDSLFWVNNLFQLVNVLAYQTNYNSPLQI